MDTTARSLLRRRGWERECGIFSHAWRTGPVLDARSNVKVTSSHIGKMPLLVCGFTSVVSPVARRRPQQRTRGTATPYGVTLLFALPPESLSGKEYISYVGRVGTERISS